MVLEAADITMYGSDNMQETDSGTQGGAIDTSILIPPSSSTLFNTLNDTVEVISDASGDTSQDVTVYGRNSEGSIVNEVLNLDGTNEVAGATSFERILKVTVSASHTGNITIRKASDNSALAVLEPGILEIRRLFYNVAADAAGGSERNYYEKAFIKNEDGTSALLSAVVSEQSDAEAQIEFAIEDAQNDNGTSTNRVTAPTGITGDGFSSTQKTIPATDLGPGDAIGVWFHLTLPAGDAATKTTYGPRIEGNNA